MKRESRKCFAALLFALAACNRGSDATSSSDVTSAVIAAAASTGTLLCTPAQAALDACSAKAAGDACTLSAGDAGVTVAGTCRATVDGSSVGCVPNPPAPPQALIDACSGKAAGASCTFAERDGDTATGVCATAPDGTTIACREVRTPPQAAIDACSGKATGDTCTLPSRSDAGTGPAGTCSLGPTGAGPLACEPPHGLGADVTAACTSLAAGATCTISERGRSATGTCVTPTAGGAEVCLVACGTLCGSGPGGGGPPHH